METQPQSEERKTWLEFLIEFAKPDKMVEYGCGTAFLLEVLSNGFA